jgi:regulator of cell morphogenesis and NO signaling
MTPSFDNATIGELVAADYRRAGVFDRFGLDYCCGGKRTLEEACRLRGVSREAVVLALEEAFTAAPIVPDKSWTLDALADHIVDRHHKYVRDALPVISGHLEKLVSVHGNRHAELAEVARHFGAVADELQVHMFKEEQMLFPYIRLLCAAAEHGQPAPPNMFGTVRNPIRMMELEHQNAGDEFAVIRELTHNYVAPEDGCGTYRATFEELAAFDRDLRLHIHLENNILFPGAAALEAEVMTRVGS